MFPATLTLTILIESLALYFWHRAYQSRRGHLPFLPMLVSLTIANLVTQTLLYSALSLPGMNYWRTLLMAEIVIVLIEAAALALTKLPIRKAFLVSLGVNLLSFLTGLLIQI